MTTRFAKTLRFLGAAATVVIAMAAGPARAVDLSDPVLLVASTELDGSPFEQSVVFAAPLPNGGHIGFIVNRRTSVRLDTLFPDDSAARNVDEPVYLGGTGLLPAVFAVTRSLPPGSQGTVVPLMPGLVVAIDAATVDRIIESTPNDARYFVGAMLWQPGELEQEVDNHQWETRPPDVDTVLGPRSNGLWKSLHDPWV